MSAIVWVVYVLIALGISAVFFFILLVTKNVEQEKLVLRELRNLPKSRRFVKEKKEVWAKLSISGENPILVIALARYIVADLTSFEKSKMFASSYYSQVKFLLKKFHLFRAGIFWLHSDGYAKTALMLWDTVPDTKKSQIDLEVLGAPYFMLAMKLPFIGRLYKKKALDFLLRTDSETNIIQAVAPDNALIYSKIYALSKDEDYRNKVANAGITREMDPDKLRRIVQHLGMDSVDELFEFCKI